MVHNELNLKTLYLAIINGCHWLLERRDEVNRINVFPVADGDTGDNMASVCSAIIEGSEVRANTQLTFESIAQAAITGSRGNSGILLTHFFVGLHQHLPASNELRVQDFYTALKKTGERIHAALATPVEGTIITLIQKLGEFAHAHQSVGSIAQAMSLITPALKKEVEQTTARLKVLEESKVVDAGALGFYYLIEGFTDFLVKGISLVPQKVKRIHPLTEHDHPLNEPPLFRYCTEAVLKNPKVSQEELLHQLGTTGDCAAVIGINDLLKVHVHLDDPSQLFGRLYQLGTVKHPKVDDMQRQYEVGLQSKGTIALVTDSSADLPQTLLDKYQIHTLALKIHIGEHDFLDRYSMEPKLFYHQLEELPVYPKTSCASPYEVKQYLNRLCARYDQVLILSISSALSGMYNSFAQASKGVQQISLIDTKTNSAAHGLLLEYAGQLIAKNHSFAQVIQEVQAAVEKTFLFVLVNQLDCMIRSGRLSKLLGTLASLTHLKPIVSLDKDGRGFVAGKVFSFEKGLHQLVHLVQKKLEQANARLEDYAIVHAGNEEDAQKLAKISTAYWNKPPLFISTASVVIGLHAGKGCVALAARMSPGLSRL
jgi:DegV family protein with EDD domain